MQKWSTGKGAVRNSAVGEEVRDFVVERAIQVGERDVRLVLAALGRNAAIADGGLAGAHEPGEVWRGRHACPERGRLPAAKTADARERDLEGCCGDAAKLRVDVAGDGLIHVTDEAEGEVVLLRRAPGRTWHICLQRQQPVGDAFGNRDGQEKTKAHASPS